MERAESGSRGRGQVGKDRGKGVHHSTRTREPTKQVGSATSVRVRNWRWAVDPRSLPLQSVSEALTYAEGALETSAPVSSWLKYVAALTPGPQLPGHGRQAPPPKLKLRS